MRRRRVVYVLAGLAALGLGWAGLLPAQGERPASSYRSRELAGRQEGEVLLDGQVVIRIRTSAGGFSAVERARIVSDRLNGMLAAGIRGDDFRVGGMRGEAVVLGRDKLLITADEEHARLNATTPEGLAYTWANNVREALGAPPLSAPRRNTGGGQTRYFPDWSARDRKDVPVVSVGIPGVELGFARVVGPAEQVAKVRAVTQLDLTFRRSFRMRVYIPTGSIGSTNRVQGTSVEALAGARVIEF